MKPAPLSRLEILALAGMVVQQVYVASVVPASPFSHLNQPVYLATLLAPVTCVVLIALRFRAPRAVRLEKLLLALFLGGMPFVYASTALLGGHPVGAELVGIAVFVPLALAGYRGSPWFLAAGIAAHGVGWDLWHHPGELVVPRWYALGCLVVDVALGAYVATQVAAYREGGARSLAQSQSGEGFRSWKKRPPAESSSA